MKLKTLMAESGKSVHFDHAIIREYEQILQGKQKRFTNGTWQKPNAKYYAQIVLRYLFEEKLNYSVDDIKSIPQAVIFKKKWRLNGLVQYVYDQSFQEAVIDLYGEWIKPWDFRHAARYLPFEERIEDWLGEFGSTFLHFKSKDEVLTFFTTTNLRNNHNKLFDYFNGSPYDAYLYFHEKGYISFPIAPYEFHNSYNNIWEDKHMVNDFLSHLMQESNIQSKDDLTKFLGSRKFRTKMKGLLNKFHASTWEIYQYLKQENIVPYEITVFDLSVLPNGFYQDDNNKIEALRWLIYDKLEVLSRSDYIDKFSMKAIDKHIRGIGPYFSTVEELYRFIEEHQIIPWHILPWEYKTRPTVLWEDESIREQAIIWFFEVFLGLKPNEVRGDNFKVKSIWDARLKELYQPHFSQVYENPKEMWVSSYFDAKQKQ